MYHRDNSSSDQEDANFEGIKRVTDQYNGSAFDSGDNQSMIDQSESVQESRRHNQHRGRNNSRLDGPHEEKSRAIKKNRESAKISRLRKKEYQEVLEQKVEELKSDISVRKLNIRSISDSILNKFKKTNIDKYKYLVQKMSLSSRLLNVSQDLRKLRKVQDQSKNCSQNNQEARNVDQSSMLAQYSAMKGPHKDEKTKSTKYKKKKGALAAEEEKIKIEEEIKEKEGLLEMTIKAYMYEFGVKGCLRSDIIERSKREWLQTIKKTIPYETADIREKVSGMKHCLDKLDAQTKLLDYHLRELKDRVKDKYVVQFLLDRQFFINNSEETIYKNSQLKSSNF